MRFKVLDVVVLQKDLPANGLKRGDLGAIVDLHEPDGIEVEFVTASGRTEALVSLRATEVRAVANNDLISVRSYSGAA